MWAKTVLSLVGGVRAAFFLFSCLVLLLVVGLQRVKIESQKDSHEAYVAKVVEATSKARDAARVALVKSKEALIEYHEKSKSADEAYAAGRESAIHAQTTLVSDLRNGNQRLQQQWRGCESDRVREGQAASGTASGPDEQAELRFQSASRAIAAGDEADATVTWLQSELLATRELYGKCMVPKEN